MENTFRGTLIKEGGGSTLNSSIKYLFLVMIELSNKPVKEGKLCYLQTEGMPFIKQTLDDDK